jgi:hypothetical protein
MTMLATLLLSLAAAAGPPRPGGRAALAFDLPAGFLARQGRVDGQPVSLATGPAGEAVAVLLLDAPAALECGRAEGSPAGLAPLRTRGGIDGCLAVRRDGAGALALAQVSTSAASATIAVLASDEAAAHALALQVAGSLRESPR